MASSTPAMHSAADAAVLHTRSGSHPLRIRLAGGFWSRFRGLMLARTLAPHDGLLITRCPSVHTAFMRMTIDVVYLDATGKVLECVAGLKPWRFSIGARRDAAGRRHGSPAHCLELRWQALHAALSGNDWMQLWDRACAYAYWDSRISHIAQLRVWQDFQSGKRPQYLGFMMLHRMGFVMANCLALGWMERAVDLVTRARWALERNGFNDGGDETHRRTQHFVLRLVGDWQGWPEPKGPRCAFDEPIFNALVSQWREPEPDSLVPLLLAACDRHTHEARTDSNKGWYDLPWLDTWYVPFEVLAVLKLRAAQGLANPPLDTLASYRYNHRGERISKRAGSEVVHYLYNERRQRLAELDAQGRVTRQYVWLADQLVALIDPQQPRAPQAPAEGLMQQLGSTAQALRAGVSRNQSTLNYVHVNHLGAPVAMTDENAKPVWTSDYAPFGKRIAGASQVGIIETAAPGHVAQAGVQGIRLDLRLPGQWEDAESGLYYNDHRYYDPERGRYLSPDPLGLNGGLNAYAYVDNNPTAFSDPLGLVLFAFDGTSNDETDATRLSNVVRFKELYRDGPPNYITGPGTLDPATGIVNPLLKGGNLVDVAEALTGKARITAMIDRLNIYSNDFKDDNTAFDIDVVGFSRGSAEARDFANQINSRFSNGYYKYTDANGKAQCQKVNFRFMGLWDTVLSNHVGTYDLGIPAAFKYVAHATALNEYRGTLPSFPSESILGAPTPPDTTRIERGFLGAHSDIGGSFPEGDLAKVAMVWMVDQAKTAGVKIDEPDRNLIANPVIHDKSSNLLIGQPTDRSEDRDVRYRDGKVVKQRKTTDQGMTYTDTQKFITYKPDPNTSDYISGTVDAKAYLAWLNANGYNINMTVN